ncbi:hypothetical protein TNIN_428331 [Trichonephila inaurata madagascariensis]|uniref:Uncharacterized protein n=1 Tax=Trichonephila inaurata madagascariensis TaxID=2747483 RepID=A0A8X7CAW7_9ARAC|nr:hypothetical protein TNIN_428331 [Trichonephila inaurata madagascariensis]
MQIHECPGTGPPPRGSQSPWHRRSSLRRPCHRPHCLSIQTTGSLRARSPGQSGRIRSDPTHHCYRNESLGGPPCGRYGMDEGRFPCAWKEIICTEV